MPGLESIAVGDLLHIIFRIGYAAQFVPSRTQRLMIVKRMKPQRPGLTAMVGRLSEIPVTLDDSMVLYGGPPTFANSEFSAVSDAPGFQEGANSATIHVGLRFIARIEKIVVNPDADNDEHYTNPGQQGLGAARVNARWFRIPIHLSFGLV